MRIPLSILFAFGITLALTVDAAPVGDKSLDVNQTKVDQWNHFSEQLIELHRKLTSSEVIHKEVKQGGYHGEIFNRQDFFVEETYYKHQNGQLISRVKWEKDRPKNIHVLEVYIYDEKGRVTRDYLVAFLPWARNAPIQALINFHSYSGGLHGFRQFDASGERVYEQCDGMMGGKVIDISLESHEIVPPRVEQKDYKKCFSSAPLEVSKYLTPQ